MQQITRTDGAWISEQDEVSRILNYTVGENQFVDTNFPSNHVVMAIHGISSTQVVACSFRPLSQIPDIFYYENKKLNQGWQLIDNSNINVNGCFFSHG